MIRFYWFTILHNLKIFYNLGFISDIKTIYLDFRKIYNKYTMSILQIENLNLGFNTENGFRQALFDVSLALEEGDTFEFGKYTIGTEKDPEKKKPIEWVVASKYDDGYSMVLTSEYILTYMPFDESKKSGVTWETSSLRKWLNGKFLESAFFILDIFLFPSILDLKLLIVLLHLCFIIFE